METRADVKAFLKRKVEASIINRQPFANIVI
jgi:hypothetical protein